MRILLGSMIVVELAPSLGTGNLVFSGL